MSRRSNDAEMIEATAKREFADHVIDERHSMQRMWRCAKPGTGIYSFTVALMHGGFVAVAGDVGDIILRVSEPDVIGVLSWLRDLRREQIDYFIGKAQPVCRDAMEEFSPEVARETLREMDAPCEPDCIKSQEQDGLLCECGKSLERMKSGKIRAEWDGETQYSWCEACHAVWDDCDWPDCLVPSSSALWAFECLHRFIELYDDLPFGHPLRIRRPDAAPFGPEVDAGRDVAETKGGE